MFSSEIPSFLSTMLTNWNQHTESIENRMDTLRIEWTHYVHTNGTSGH